MNSMDKLITKKLVLIGIRVRARRKKLGLTLFQLAVDSDVSMTAISDLERCLKSGITICTLIKIANALNMEVEDLFKE